MNPILLIPARMASTRLPGKPLADIAGVPMIVRVWARAVAAGLGPVVVAAGEPEIVAAVEKAGGQAVLTDPDLPSGSDRICAALAGRGPRGRAMTWWSICRATCRRSIPDQLKAAVGALAKSGADIATLAAPNPRSPPNETNPAVVKAVVAWDADERLGPRALFHPRAPRPPARARCFIMSAFMPIAAPRWRASSPCRLRRWSSARSWNSCGRWKRV